MKKYINGSKIFDFFNIIFMLVIVFITAYPVYYVVIASFSDPGLLTRHVGMLWSPIKPFTLDAYKMVFDNPSIVSGFRNTLFVMVFGLAVNMTMTAMGGYFLTIKGPFFKSAITMMIVFTMYFGGGMVPVYLNIKDLKLLDSLWSLILPAAVSTSNLIIMKAAFQAIPDSLEESARLDGASYIQILVRIMVPLSKATLAVLLLYYAVGHWNSWFSASIYLRDRDLFPLQLVTRNILNNATSTLADGIGMDEVAQVANLIKYALIVVTTIPILLVYPFLQKYFVKGVMVGAIKG